MKDGGYLKAVFIMTYETEETPPMPFVFVLNFVMQSKVGHNLIFAYILYIYTHTHNRPKLLLLWSWPYSVLHPILRNGNCANVYSDSRCNYIIYEAHNID